jgi:ankyrin repeat protein
MKRLVLNMVCPMVSSVSGKALVRVETGNNSPVYPLFLRDVGKYYWNKKHVFSEYNTSVCLKNMYTRMFRFFGKQRKLFYKACEHGNLEAVKYLLRKDKNNLSDEHGLYIACFAGRLKVVKYLIQQGTNMYSGYGRNAMVSACRKGRTDVVKYLASAGFDLKEGWEEYTYPLCENNYLDTLKSLLLVVVCPLEVV